MGRGIFGAIFFFSGKSDFGAGMARGVQQQTHTTILVLVRRSFSGRGMVAWPCSCWVRWEGRIRRITLLFDDTCIYLILKDLALPGGRPEGGGGGERDDSGTGVSG